MSQWWVKRSSSAVVILASPNTLGHSPNARLVVMMIEVRSRDPSPKFDTSWYLRSYSDVRKSGLNPLAHYLRKGAAEGRRIANSE